jgi:hypothetical protein
MKKLQGIYNKLTGEERFWSKIDIKNKEECWEWKSGVDNYGYGWFRTNEGMNRSHRVAWELYYNRKIPKDKIVRHWKCDNVLCCNPFHLRLGTHQDNTNDKVKRERQSRLFGEDNGRAKLTSKQIIQIRKYYSTGEYTQQSLADFYEVSQGLIGFIVRKENWQHI